MPRPVFDATIHQPHRLQLCGLLANAPELEFADLRADLLVSDSVLSKHLRTLDAVGYVTTRRVLDSSRLRTRVRLTTAGREALCGHVAELQRLAGVASLRPTSRSLPRTGTGTPGR